MSDTAEEGIFINGRQQIIEMLQFMNESERKKLLDNVRLRNAVMARELSEQSFSFKDLGKLPQNFLGKILSQVNPAIVGLAIYDESAEIQRYALNCIPRESAEAAFKIMSQNLNGKKQECKRAKDNIIRLAIDLSRKHEVNI